jgi:hypothetical protein
MKWIVMGVFLVAALGGCRTIGDLNPQVAGTEVGDIKVSPLTGSVTSVFESTGQVNENGKDVLRTVQVVKHDRPVIDGINAMVSSAANVALPVAALKWAFDPATQRHEVHGKYEVNKRIFRGYGSGTITPQYPGGNGTVPQAPGGSPAPGVGD